MFPPPPCPLIGGRARRCAVLELVARKLRRRLTLRLILGPENPQKRTVHGTVRLFHNSHLLQLFPSFLSGLRFGLLAAHGKHCWNGASRRTCATLPYLCLPSPRSTTSGWDTRAPSPRRCSNRRGTARLWIPGRARRSKRCASSCTPAAYPREILTPFCSPTF